jgi:hypothetical protein
MKLKILPKDKAFFYLPLVILSFLSYVKEANAQTFGAGVFTGVNFSQIDGDGSAGYNKAGLESGLMGLVYFTSRWHGRISIAYSERGAFSYFLNYSSEDILRIRLKYISVPVEIVFNDWEHENGYYKMQFLGGMTYGRLFNQEVIDPFNQIASNGYNANDISWHAGAQYMINKQLAFMIKYTGSLNLLYDRRKNNAVNFPSLRGYFLTLQVMYFLK